MLKRKLLSLSSSAKDRKINIMIFCWNNMYCEKHYTNKLDFWLNLTELLDIRSCSAWDNDVQFVNNALFWVRSF